MHTADEIDDLRHAFDRMAEQLHDSVEELTRQELSDNRTALPNRVLLRQRLEQTIATGGPLALLVKALGQWS